MAKLTQSFQEVWQRAGLMQRLLLISLLLACLAAGAVLVNWATKPDYALLYSGLSPEEAAKVVEKVADADVQYKLKNGGTTIYVEQDKVYSLRLAVAQQGLAVGGHVGYKILDDSKIGMSPFAQRVNYIRAVEGELAKSIETLDAVASARVHIVRPEGPLFSREQKSGSATVVIGLKGSRQLTPNNVAAIVNLVAGGVEDLQSEDVVVVDNNGNLLSGEGGNELAGKAGTVLDYKQRVEQYKARQIEAVLLPVLGPGRVSVRVDAEIDLTSLSTVATTYPGKGIEKEIITEALKEKTSSGGENGKSTDKTGGGKIETNFRLSQTTTQTVVLPGEIKKLTVAAFVDLSAPKAEVTEGEDGDQGKEVAEAPPAPTVTVEEIAAMIQKVTGAAEEDITVVSTTFHKPKPLLSQAEQEQGKGKEFWMDIARRASLGILALGALLALKMFGKGKSKKGEDAPALEGQAGAADAGLLLPGPETQMNPELVRRQITRALENNPEEVSRLFLSWVGSEEGKA